MAYGKFYGRRNYRRSRRYLSNRYIYSKTHAKSQAKQIATLRNRVAKLAKDSRKELRNVQNTFTKTFTNSALSDVYATFKLNTIPVQGQWTRMRGFSLNGILEYGDNKEQYPQVDITRSGSVRILIYQAIQSRGSGIDVDYVLDVSNTGLDYELNTTRPLKDGVTSFVKILSDKTYTLSDQQPQKRVHINLKRLLNLHRETDDRDPRGTIFVGIVTSGLHWTSGGYNENITASLIAKQVYTED